MLLLLTLACAPGASSYAILATTDQGLHLWEDDALSSPLQANTSLMARLGDHAVALSTESSWTVQRWDADGQMVDALPYDYLTTGQVWLTAPEVSRAYVVQPGILELDFEAGTVTELSAPEEQETLYAVSADASLQLLYSRVDGLSGVRVWEGDTPLFELDPLRFNHNTLAAFDADGARVYHLQEADGAGDAFGYTRLDDQSFTPLRTTTARVAAIERIGGQIVVLFDDQQTWYAYDPDTDQETVLMEGRSPLGGLSGFAPDLAWALWGTELYDTHEGFYRYELQKLPVEEGSRAVRLTEEVEFGVTGAVLLP
ncbi:MAG: hypothetical protein H6739_39960 [Alphaproteobacteria bacterium]|nr:hypothetical protein [Alphaproteobacteria bacterium]